MSLAVARGLPGSEGVNEAACLERLDKLARIVGQHTAAGASAFRRHPEQYDHSWAVFRVMDMLTVLQRDLGFRYNPDLVNRDDFFADSRNLFLQGVLQTRMGTCSSLPPFYVAVGRRLGYPLKLVSTKFHLFARWDGEGERFNIECTAQGLNCYPDEYYLRWPAETTPQEVERFGFLRSWTPREELAGLLVNRGHCWLDNGRHRQAVQAYADAQELMPESWGPSQGLVLAMNRWDKHLAKMLVPGFPSVTIINTPRQFASLPDNLNAGIIHLAVKENLLTDPGLRGMWLEPFQRDPSLCATAHVTVRYPTTGQGDPDVTYLPSMPAEFASLPRQPA
jgi:hypothetical protein